MALTLDKVARILRYEGVLGLARIVQKKLAQPKAISGTYAQWVERYDIFDDDQRLACRTRLKTLANQPLVSVIMPLDHVSLDHLDRAIQSVQQQIYPHWELCLVSYGTTQPQVCERLSHYEATETRVNVQHQPTLATCSAASHAGLAVAAGEWIAFLKPNDVLAEQAFYCVIEAMNRYPQASLLYSDEDGLNERGDRVDPYFKCGFNYELFLAQDMISNLAVYRHSLIQQVGGFRDGYDGAAHYDLALRALDHLKPDQIIHIPRVLYHRHHQPQDGSPPHKTAQLRIAAQRRALRDHLHRRSIEATVSPAPESPEHHRVRYALPAVLPLVSIVIPTRDRADLLKVCLDALFHRSIYSNLEVIIIDNGSTEPATAQMFSQLPTDRVRILRDESPFNFSALINQGVSLAQGEFVCLMNNDIEIITPDWLEEMISFAQRPDIGCVGARLWYPGGTLQHGGVITGIRGVAGHAHLNLCRGDRGYFCRAVLHQSFSAVTAACLVVRRSIFQQVNGFDKALAVAFNDVDFCLRVGQAGFRNVWTPYAEMIHHESASRGYETNPHQQARIQEEISLIQQRWGGILFNDPAYNPNLSLATPMFNYAFPPRTQA
jgi:GT2 family glycosyltransferase